MTFEEKLSTISFEFVSPKVPVRLGILASKFDKLEIVASNVALSFVRLEKERKYTVFYILTLYTLAFLNLLLRMYCGDEKRRSL